MTGQAPAGWYPQPDGTQRYWDGVQWTEHIAPGAGVAPAEVQQPAAAQPVAAPADAEASVVPAEATTMAVPLGAAAPAAAAATDERAWWKKKRFIIPGGIVALILIVAAATSGSSDKGTVAEPTDAPATSSAPEPSETAAATSFTMPDLVGMNLQDAQDELQGLGSLLMDQTDASGQDRLQVDDSNWQVCTQDPAAGTEAPIETVVTLGAVKLDESCDGGAAIAEPDDSDLTAEQQEALDRAQEYLEFTAFSKKGLIDQLEFEGFSNKDADAAVSVLVIDWNDQATRKAEDYLDLSGFSKKGLIDQLEFEGFTSKQATAGVEAVGADWNEQAARKAEEYLDSMSFSKSGLIDQLVFEGFTKKQAQYGVKEAGL